MTPKAEVPTIELKKIVCTIGKTQSVNLIIFGITTNFRRLIRIVAYCKRFIKHCRSRPKDESTNLTTRELRDSLYTLVKLAQEESFPMEIQILRKKESITKGRLTALNVFIDQQGLIRVGSRLRHSQFTIDKKHYSIIL